MAKTIENFGPTERMVYEVIRKAAADGVDAPPNSVLMFITGMGETAIQRRIRRLAENKLIRINSRGGARAFYVFELDKWTGVRTATNKASAYLSHLAQEESTETPQDQCRAHTKQLAAIKQKFEDVNVKPMRTIDCRGWGTQHSYGVVNYAALGWS